MINLEEVEAFATGAHTGQMYSDEPYINHCKRVANKMVQPVDKAVALLHDVVEDTPITVDQIRALFGDEVADAVDSITRRKSELHLENYIPRVAMSKIATRVKIMDLVENIEHAKTSETHKSLLPRYHTAISYLIKVFVSDIYNPD
jgi:(p)ppGpp synthase/HD superfamily hydrolase